MSAVVILGKLILVAGILVWQSGAMEDRQYFRIPQVEIDRVYDVMLSHGRSIPDVLEIIEYIQTLSPTEGKALLDLTSGSNEGYLYGGIRSDAFKILVATVVPHAFEESGAKELDSSKLLFHIELLLPIDLCAENPQKCDGIRASLGRTDFAMAAFISAYFGPREGLRRRRAPGGDPKDFVINLLYSRHPKDWFLFDEVRELLSHETVQHMVELVQEVRKFHNLHNRNDPVQTTDLFLKVWTHLRNEASLGEIGRARRDVIEEALLHRPPRLKRKERRRLARERAAAEAMLPPRIEWAAWGRGLLGRAAGIIGHAAKAVHKAVADLGAHALDGARGGHPE